MISFETTAVDFAILAKAFKNFFAASGLFYTEEILELNAILVSFMLSMEGAELSMIADSD